MKKLFIILAIALTVQCIAQDKIENIVCVYNDTDTIKDVNTSLLKVGTIVLDENIHGAVRNATFAEELLFLLQDYETECYNDSTKMGYDFFVWMDDTIMMTPSIDPGHTPGYIDTRSIYIHKEPTFKGFIEWLKNKTLK